MAILRFVVAAKVDVYGDCVKLKSGQVFTDSIYKGLEYTGNTPKFITVVNTCSTQFTVPAQTVITLEGGFRGTIASTDIPANSEVNIPVVYNGSYTGTAPTTLTGNISLNGSSIPYSIQAMIVDQPPVTQDNVINLQNRQNTVINKSNLIYSDPNNDAVTNVRFTGDTSKLFTDSEMTVPYVSGTELGIDFILYFKAPNQDALSTYAVNYDVKANGVWSV